MGKGIVPEQEIEAMMGVSEALSPLDAETRSRVLRWAAERYGVELVPLLSRPNSARISVNGVSGSNLESETEDNEAEGAGGTASKSVANGVSLSIIPASFEHFADLFAAVQPKSDLEKAMTAAYWEQMIQGKSSWQSATLNKELRDLGHRISSITRALGKGIERRPALVLQLKKTGTAQQGRKTYKLSNEGIKFIRVKVEQPLWRLTYPLMMRLQVSQPDCVAIS